MINLHRDVFFSPQAIITESKSIAAKPSSERAKLVAERFIRFLSTCQSPPSWPCLNAHASISDSERKELTELFSAQIVEKLEQCSDSLKAFQIVGRGKHNTVWGHESYPHIVFKLMTQEEAKKQDEVAQKAREVTRGRAHCWVQIPRTATIQTEKVAIYVEERLPLVCNTEEHQELWARVIAHYQSSPSSSLFNQNLEKLISDIQFVIDQIGFWDVGYKNLPEVRIDGAGVCGVDFENVDLEGKIEGIERLAHLLPVSPLVDDLSNKYAQEIPNVYIQKMKSYNSTVEQYIKFNLDVAPIPKPTEAIIQKQFNEKLEDKREDLKALQTALQQYDQKGYITGNEELVNCGEFSSLNEEENKLAQYLLKLISTKFYEQKASKRSLTSIRSIYLQPDYDYSLKKESVLYTRESFLKALNALKEQGLVVSWSDDHKHQERTGCKEGTAYTIYF